METYPGGRTFAFSILDDTDDSTLENVRPVYDCLREYGLRTTKTVWTHDTSARSRIFFAADTLERPEYLAWVHELVDAGFELASHGASMESSDRETTREGLKRLTAEFGAAPRLYVNHGFNRENVYWGARRFSSPLIRWAISRLRDEGSFDGEREGADHFWGDLCREHIDYVRNFTFSGLDNLRDNPEMPYQRADAPFVKQWFSTTDAPDVSVFNARVTPEALAELEARGGVCIVSTHLGKGFTHDGRVDPEFEATLRYLAGRPGWYVPVSEILDHLVARGAGRPLSATALRRLELRYLRDQLMTKLGLRR